MEGNNSISDNKYQLKKHEFEKQISELSTSQEEFLQKMSRLISWNVNSTAILSFKELIIH